MHIRENRGITLTTLVVTVIVLLILAGVATSTGIEAIENTKHTKFVAELKIMQSYVNQWYEDCKPSSNETFEGNIANKFTAINAQNATEDTQAQTTLTNANVLLAEFSNYYILDDDQKNALGVEGVSQKVLVSVKNRKVVSYDGLKWKNNMYYTIDDQSGDGLGEIYNVEYQNPNTNSPTIEVTGKSVYYGDTAKNAKYRFTVNVTQGSSYINKGDLYYGKKENENVRNWQKTADNTLLVDREGTYQFYYKDAAGNVSNVFEYVIEPKATLINGLEFNAKMKELSGTESPSISTKNTNITAFKISTKKPNNSVLVDTNKVSTNDSLYPVYMWFDNGTILLWSEENWIAMNAYSYGMYRGLTMLESIDLKIFYTNKVFSIRTMFYDCSSLTNLNLSHFDTNNVTDMGYLFNNCNSLTNLDISKFNTQNVTDMEAMFRNCINLNVLDVENFNTGNVTVMNNMFHNCEKLTELNLNNFDTSKVTTMKAMFDNCNHLEKLYLLNFDTSKVENMWYMFNNCNNLINIFVGNKFVITALTNEHISGYASNHTTSTFLFNNCTNLVGGAGTTYNSSHVDSDYAHIDGGPSNPGYFTRKENI